MPVWGWILLIAFLSAAAVAAVMAIVRATHRLPAEEPVPSDHTNFAAPLPPDVAGAMTLRERDAEETSSRSRQSLSRNR